MKKPKNSLTRQQMKLERRAKRFYALAVCFLLTMLVLIIPAFAADDPLAAVRSCPILSSLSSAPWA